MAAYAATKSPRNSLKQASQQVILGSLAFSDPSVIAKIQKRFGSDSVIVALDNKEGRIMVEGWQTETAMTVDDALFRNTLNWASKLSS